MKKLILVALPLMLVAANASAADPVPFDKQDSCTTSSTDGDGERHSCDYSVCYAASTGNFIDEASLASAELDGRGSEHSCSAPVVTRRDKVKVRMPNGLTVEMEFPTEVCITGHARSPKGHWAGTGRSECRVSGRVLPYN